jgi:hypothetical protein
MGYEAVSLGLQFLFFQRIKMLHAEAEIAGAQRPTKVPTLQCSVLLSPMLKTFQMKNLI